MLFTVTAVAALCTPNFVTSTTCDVVNCDKMSKKLDSIIDVVVMIDRENLV